MDSTNQNRDIMTFWSKQIISIYLLVLVFSVNTAWISPEYNSRGLERHGLYKNINFTFVAMGMYKSMNPFHVEGHYGPVKYDARRVVDICSIEAWNATIRTNLNSEFYTDWMLGTVCDKYFCQPDSVYHKFYVRANETRFARSHLELMALCMCDMHFTTQFIEKVQNSSCKLTPNSFFEI
jgi:hypothetical protein